MRSEVTTRLDKNLNRVENLVSLFKPSSSRGTSTVKDTDLLRAAVVLLHASMEDYLRSLVESRIKTFDANTLGDFGFSSGSGRSVGKISLQELHAHKGKTVDELIHEEVKAYLEDESFGDLGKVKRALERCGVERATVEKHEFGKLPEMISRRHDIVHKADVTARSKRSGRPTTKGIKPGTVKDYLQSMKDLRDLVSKELGDT